MSIRCYKCFRPNEYCLCRYAEPVIHSGVKFIFLMHPKEAKHQRTGTGRISHVALADSEILVGLDFTKNARLQELLNDEKYFPVLLYPGIDAWTVKKTGFKEEIGDRTLLVLIIDATWFCSRKIIEHTPSLLALPRVSFAGEYRSIFTFKHEPRPEYISTIESCYYLIKELQEGSIIDNAINPEPLMNVFKKMIQDQLVAENERIEGIRPNTHSTDWKYQQKKEVPNF